MNFENGVPSKERFELPTDDEFEDDESEVLDDELASTEIPENQNLIDDDSLDISEGETQDFAQPTTEDDIPEQDINQEHEQQQEHREESPIRHQHMDINESPASSAETSQAAPETREQPERAPEPVEPEKKEKKKKFFDTEFYFGRPLSSMTKQDTGRPVQKSSSFSTPSLTPKRSGYVQSSVSSVKKDPLLDKIMSIVVSNPSYGPSAIRLALIKMGQADDSLTRSMIFKKLNDADLSTRNKRIEYAQTRRR
ncbi:MAG: hypothetical protein DWQ10_12370 [Calditrichaeota bacterium]|nr:MAG: hypothetical protein DWQ10_12370 [Calditrichota bacterium]